MPAAVPVTYADYRSVREGLEVMGFREIPRWVKHKIVEYRNGIAIEISVLAGEVGFEFSHRGYRVRVWTSCRRDLVWRRDWMPSTSFDIVVGRPASEDAGHILIVDGASGYSQYFARRVMRTKNFVQNLLERARITQKKIVEWPACHRCGQPMAIARKEKTGATYWECRRRHDNGRPVWKGWDFALTGEDLRIARNWRRSRLYSREKTREQRIAKEAAVIPAENSGASS